jgi:hypothetical protein
MRVLVAIVLSSVLCFPSVGQRGEELDFPTNAEISLMVTQTERAMDQYATLVQQQEKLLSGVPDVDTATDKRLIQMWKTVHKALQADPQKFNSELGFDLVTIIDDASRNASLTATSAAKQTAQEIIAGHTDRAELYVTLMQNGSNASTLLYTVSENCTALYQKYLKVLHVFVDKAITALGDPKTYK